MTSAQHTFQRLVDIVDELRVKCPWDRKQTKESLRHLTIEETYELAEAILQGDYAEIKTELGDLLLHVLFYSSLAAEQEKFTLAEMIQAQIDKLIRRHPHVYGDLVGASEADIKRNWEQIKAQERVDKGETTASVLDGVPAQLPSLIKAQRMQEKASQVGFDFQKADEVWEKVEEEMAEFKAATTPEDKAGEMGDLLFSLVNYCRFAGINAEDALARTNAKFQRRFGQVEAGARAQGKMVGELSLDEMEACWQAAKEGEG